MLSGQTQSLTVEVWVMPKGNDFGCNDGRRGVPSIITSLELPKLNHRIWRKNLRDAGAYDEIQEPKGLLSKFMDSMDSLNWVMGGLAIAILIGGMLMMFTTVFTTKR